jgi:hypothetical protein
MYQSGVSIILCVSITCINHCVCMNKVCQSYIHRVKHPLWLMHTLWVIHSLWLIHTLWLIHLVDTYTMIDTPDWYILYESIIVDVSLMVYVSIIVDVSLSVCINQVYQSIAYVSIRCVSQCMHQLAISIRWIYIYYCLHTWLIHTLWLIHLIDTYTMTDTPDCYIHYDLHTWLMHTLWLIQLIDKYTMTDMCVSHSKCINQEYQS